MSAGFDRLTVRVAQVAGRMKAFGYLNTLPGDLPGDPSGLEVRFQQNPIHPLWNELKLGFAQRFARADDVATFLDVVERAIEREAAGIEANEPRALDRVLQAGVEFRRQA